jgi:hypothetical protein
MLARAPLLLPLPSPLLLLLPQLLLLLPRHHPLSAVVTFLPTFVALAALLLVAAGGSVRPQLAMLLPAMLLPVLSPAPLLLEAATRLLAAVSVVKSARPPPPLVVDGSLLPAVAHPQTPASLSPALLRQQALRAMASTGPVRSGALSDRVSFH